MAAANTTNTIPENVFPSFVVVGCSSFTLTFDDLFGPTKFTPSLI